MCELELTTFGTISNVDDIVPNDYNEPMAKIEYENRIIDTKEVFRVTEIDADHYEVELRNYELLVVDKETAKKLLGGIID